MTATVLREIRLGRGHQLKAAARHCGLAVPTLSRLEARAARNNQQRRIGR